MISKFSVKRPYTVIVGVILVIVLGVVSFTRMTTDLLPDMNLPYALVITTDVGASPEEVETDVTAPVEASMATTSSIKNVSSVSYDNYSMVILEYEQSANMDSILIEIQQKLDQLEGSFSDSVGKPMIMQIDPDMMPVMVASADVEGMDESEVSSYVENEFSPALESVEGVASVSATGVLEESVQVTMDQDKIDALNDKIQEKIEEQFADAQKELDDASAELENGEKKLESGKSELANQVSAAANQIENGKIQAYVGASELKTNMTMMTEAKKIMEKAIPALQQLYNDGIAARQQLEALKNMLTPEQQEAIAAGSAQIEQQANAQLEAIQQMGMSEGIDFFLKTAKFTNTFDVHRLTKLAYSKGDKRLANRMILSLFATFFGDNLELNNRDVLVKIAVEAGLDKDEVENVLAGDAFADEVKRDEADAQAFGIKSVPFFVINNKYSISGAQQEEFFVGALGKVLAELNAEKKEDGEV